MRCPAFVLNEPLYVAEFELSVPVRLALESGTCQDRGRVLSGALIVGYLNPNGCMGEKPA